MMHKSFREREEEDIRHLRRAFRTAIATEDTRMIAAFLEKCVRRQDGNIAYRPDLNDPEAPALHYAINSNAEAAFLNSLIGLGADPNLRDPDGRTPLHLAAARSGPAQIRALLKAGAAIEATDKNGDTALGWAAIENNADNTQVLLEAGADINHTNAKGYTPLRNALHWASFCCRPYTPARILAEHSRADLTITDNEGEALPALLERCRKLPDDLRNLITERHEKQLNGHENEIRLQRIHRQRISLLDRLPQANRPRTNRHSAHEIL